MMRRSKIVCTMGPASRSPEQVEKLIQAGMNVARLNFSHEDHASHEQAIHTIRQKARELGRSVAILQDLAGPKIRTGRLANGPVLLEPGKPFVITARDVPGDDHEVGLTYKGLPGDVQQGDTLLLADGAIELEIESVQDQDIHCNVIVGGKLGSNKGINLPARSITAPILSDKDKSDLAFGLKMGVDFVAISFVRNKEDILSVRQFVLEQGGDALLIAKIEKHEALVGIDEILPLVDGLMVARGDLGVEIPIEQIPRSQKTLIAKANAAGKPVITATQMLMSMVNSPRPTRAEVTDVANAILDGADAVMLSEESAIGKYPVEAVSMLDKIARQTEATFPFVKFRNRYDREAAISKQEAVASAACNLAATTGAKAIATSTMSGSTTCMVAKYRPEAAILGMTPSQQTYQRLALVWGVLPVLMKSVTTTEELEEQSLALSRAQGFLCAGDDIVVTAGMPLQQVGTTNLIKIVRDNGQ